VTLSSGTKLGPYEIIEPAGAGGMGEVYRARDTRLDRTVAIKALPEHSVMSSDARARFDREAKTISSLNHPNICVLHNIGHHEGIDFLVVKENGRFWNYFGCRGTPSIRLLWNSYLIWEKGGYTVDAVSVPMLESMVAVTRSGAVPRQESSG
jgi:hypothetical protein